MVPKKKQTKSVNTKKKTLKTKQQCKTSRKRTGESLDSLIEQSLVPKRESKASKARKLALALGAIGLGTYAATHKQNVFDYYNKMYDLGNMNKGVDDVNNKINEMEFKLKNDPTSLTFNEVKKNIDDIQNKINTVRPNVSGYPYLFMPYGNDEDEKNFAYEMKSIGDYLKDKNNSKLKYEESRFRNYLDYFDNLRNDYNEAFHKGALNPWAFKADGGIRLLQKSANLIKDNKPLEIDYKNLLYWLPRTINMINAIKPGRHISDLEGNVSEYIKSEDSFKNIAENAQNQNNETDKNKLQELKTYLWDLINTYNNVYGYKD